jgi:hypothetical protein
VLAARGAFCPDPPLTLNVGGNNARVLMLPSTDYDPTCITQRLSDSLVPLPVSLELLPPPLGVCLRGHGMLGAAMPEAPIDEDGDACTAEHDVWPAWEASYVHTEAQSAPVKFAPHSQLRTSSGRAQGRHELLHRRGRCGRLSRTPSHPVGDHG